MNALDHRRRSPGPLALIAAVSLAAAGCGDAPRPSVGPSPSATRSAAAPAPSPSGAPPVAPASPAPTAATIPQPAPPAGLAIAPESARIDLAMPAFSDPTAVTNPLFPVSRQASVLMLGHVDDKPFRTEVTLLPFTRIITWQGRPVETLVSQYAAFLDGRITEIAYDYYAQADDGSVWYFGEDVYDFADGAIVTTEGTWLAGKDGPAAMIMPGTPKVGDVYRPENVPGFVFEEVTVRSIDERLDGPLGPLSGGLLAHELHADGSTEDKVFAPGYGEFLTGGGGDLEALALAVPTDALAEPLPAGLKVISDAALRAFDAVGAGEWRAAGIEVRVIEEAWAGVPRSIVPAPIDPLLTQAVRRLADAVAVRRPARARSAAIEVARLGYDLQLRYRPATDVDVARFGLWAAQLLVDAAAEDARGVNADVFALDYARDRFAPTLRGELAVRLNASLGELQAAVVDADLEATAAGATELRRVVAELLPTG